MLTKGNDAKVQNEVMAQIVADTSAKWMKFTRFLPKQEIQENSQYYTYMSQRVNIEEAIQAGILGEAKDIAPGATLQELNVRKPISETDDTMDAFGKFVIKAQEAFKGNAGAGADLTIMAESYKTLSYVKQLAYSSNKLVQPVEDIKEYYGIDNIDFLGTTQADGGSLIGDKQYIGFDLRNAPLTVLYSKSSGTTVAPITSDENIADFYPIIEIMRKDIYDELPQYTKLFIQSKVGILLNKPGLALKGTCRP